MQGNNIEIDDLLKKILLLSWRISILSPPLKPFIRFSQPKGLNQCRSKRHLLNLRVFWDFDDLLQKKLLGLIKEMISPERIVKLGIKQWEKNLVQFSIGQKQLLEQAIQNKAKPAFNFYKRIGFIIKRMNVGDRFLYVGCGSGGDCLQLASEGLRVVGIDTIRPLLKIAKGWADYAGMPVNLVCMDVMKLGFKPNSFDGFLLEFYGFTPSPEQTLALQRALSSLLKPSGIGFIVGSRKKYGSYWFLQAPGLYPSKMGEWLKQQAFLDFYFSKPDNCEERLLQGLYCRAHTQESLSSELSHAFKVRECFYEDDPRYIIAVVKRKHDKFVNTVKDNRKEGYSKKGISPAALTRIKNLVKGFEILCDMLEIHYKRVRDFFENSQNNSMGSCLESISFDAAGFVDLIRELTSPK